MNVDFTAIAPLIEQLAAKLGVAAEHLWGVLVRQAVVDGVGGLIISVFAAIAIFCTIKFTPSLVNKDSELQELTWQGGVACLLIIAGIVSIVVLPVSLIGGIKHVLNPEYYAFMDIMSQIK